MKKTVLGAALLLAVVLSGCSALAEADKGNYIIAKEEQRILVAKDISWYDIEGKTLDTLRKNKVKLVNYIVEDSQLFDELQVGEAVNVIPKTNDKGQYVVMQSDPVQIVAGKIEREQDSLRSNGEH